MSSMAIVSPGRTHKPVHVASMRRNWDLESGALGLDVLSSTNALLAWLMVLVGMVAGDFGAINVMVSGEMASLLAYVMVLAAWLPTTFERET